MKDLTRRELALLCLYALILCAGLGWTGKRALRALLDARPALAAEPASTAAEAEPTALSQPPVAPPPARPQRLVLVAGAGASLPVEVRERERWLVLLTRACPAPELIEPAEVVGELRAIASAEPAADGTLVLELGPAAPRARHLALYRDRRLVQTELLDVDADELRLELVAPSGGAILRGCFRQSGRAEAPPGEVVLEREGQQVAAAVLDTVGAFRLTGLAPGSYQLVGRFPERAPWRRALSLGRDQELDLGALVLPSDATVQGALERADAGPLLYPILVEACGGPENAGQANEDWARPRLLYPDEAGHFVLPILEPGHYLIRVPAAEEGYPSPNPEPLASASLPFVVGEERTPALVLHLVETQAVRIEGKEGSDHLLGYRLRDAHGSVLRSGRLAGPPWPAFQLVPGPYALELEQPGGERQKLEFRLESGAGATVVRLP